MCTYCMRLTSSRKNLTRKKRLKGTSDFFFLGSSFHPSGATLDSLASGSTKKNSSSVGSWKERRNSVYYSYARHKPQKYYIQEQHKVPLRYARLKRWCSTSPMCATTISRTSLHTALMSQLNSSFWPFSSTTPTFLCTSSALPRF